MADQGSLIDAAAAKPSLHGPVSDWLFIEATAAASLRFPTLAVVGWIGLPKCT